MKHSLKIAAIGLFFPTHPFAISVQAQDSEKKADVKAEAKTEGAVNSNSASKKKVIKKEGSQGGQDEFEKQASQFEEQAAELAGDKAPATKSKNPVTKAKDANIQKQTPKTKVDAKGKQSSGAKAVINNKQLEKGKPIKGAAGKKGVTQGQDVKGKPEIAVKPTPAPKPKPKFPYQFKIPKSQSSVSSLRPEGVYGHLFKSALNLLKKEMSAQEDNPQFQRAVFAEVERSRKVLQRQLGLQLSQLKVKTVSGPSPFIKMKRVSFIGERGAIKRPDSLTSRRNVILQATGSERIWLLGSQSQTITKEKLLFERQRTGQPRAQLYAVNFKNHDDYRVLSDIGYIPGSALGCLQDNAITFLYPSIEAGGRPKVNTNPRRMYYYPLKERHKLELWKRNETHWGSISVPVTHSSDCKTFVFNLPLIVRGTSRKYGEVVLVSEQAENSWINTSMVKTGASSTEVLRFSETSLMKKKGDVVPTVAILDNKRNILWFFIPQKKDTFRSLQWRRVRLPLPDGMTQIRSLAQSERGDVLYFTYSSYDEDTGTQSSGVALVNSADVEAGPKKIIESTYYRFNSVAAHPSGQRLVVSYSSGNRAGVGEIIPAGKRVAFWVVESIPPFHTLNGQHQAVPRYNTSGNLLIFQRIQGERYKSQNGDSKSRFPMEFVSWEVVGNNHF